MATFVHHRFRQSAVMTPNSVTFPNFGSRTCPEGVMSNQTIHRWCSPKTVLVIVQCSDDANQALRLVHHAHTAGARLILVQVCGDLPPAIDADKARAPVAPEAKEFLPSDWTSSHSWDEVYRRAFVLKNVPSRDTPLLVRRFKVDRVLLFASRLRAQTQLSGLQRTLPDLVNVPIWLFPYPVRNQADAGQFPQRILLPVSDGPQNGVGFSFAYELARMQSAGLTVLHVFPQSGSLGQSNRNPFTVMSWLPLPADSSPGRCRIEISVRQGDPATEILEFEKSKPHDLIVLRSTSSPGAASRQHDTLIEKVCSQSGCPVVLLGSGIQGLQDTAPPKNAHHASAHPIATLTSTD
ncbi:universal stress protein [Acidobacteria bacterium AB60]|nr:universal stress protein [Acidobacteria bacterium AB60]